MKLVSRLHECFKLFFSFLITPLQFFYFFTFLSSSLAGIETSLFEILTILNFPSELRFELMVCLLNILKIIIFYLKKYNGSFLPDPAIGRSEWRGFLLIYFIVDQNLLKMFCRSKIPKEMLCRSYFLVPFPISGLMLDYREETSIFGIRFTNFWWA